MWQRRRAPYGALSPGDRILVVDTFRHQRTVAWEYEARDVSHEPYRSLAEAARVISRGVGAASGLTPQAVRRHPYTRAAPSAGYLVAWRGRPIRRWYAPLPPEVRLARHGYTNVFEVALEGLNARFVRRVSFSPLPTGPHVRSRSGSTDLVCCRRVQLNRGVAPAKLPA